jgi:putative intracellular protease/amidase
VTWSQLSISACDAALRVKRCSMRIAVLTFDGFNEIDSFVALHILGRVKAPGWSVQIAAPEPTVTSMNGVTVTAGGSLEEASIMDAVLIGSGMKTRQLASDPELLSRVQVDAFVEHALDIVASAASFAR